MVIVLDGSAPKPQLNLVGSHTPIRHSTPLQSQQIYALGFRACPVNGDTLTRPIRHQTVSTGFPRPKTHSEFESFLGVTVPSHTPLPIPRHHLLKILGPTVCGPTALQNEMASPTHLDIRSEQYSNHTWYMVGPTSGRTSALCQRSSLVPISLQRIFSTSCIAAAHCFRVCIVSNTQC